MQKSENTGVYQLDNGYWAYRYTIVINGQKKYAKKTKGIDGKPFKTEKQAARERGRAIAKAQMDIEPVKKMPKKTVADVYNEYCETGRLGKAYGTIKKQDSVWNNHIKKEFGKRNLDSITVAEIKDYLAKLYYEEDKAYSYVDGFLKIFYLIYGQAYSRGYISVELYSKMCQNKGTRISMPKRKIDDDTGSIKIFTKEELLQLDDYFKGTNAETAYMLGKCCGLRVNECYGLIWSDINFEEGVIIVKRQMQELKGMFKLAPLKTRNAKRAIYISEELQEYLKAVKAEIDFSNEKYKEQRKYKEVLLENVSGGFISSLELVNTLPNGKMQTRGAITYHGKMIKRNLGIDFKFHYLRHTYGTMLADMNTPAHILKNQMGHSNINVTQRYYITLSQAGIEILKNNLNKI